MRPKAVSNTTSLTHMGVPLLGPATCPTYMYSHLMCVLDQAVSIVMQHNSNGQLESIPTRVLLPEISHVATSKFSSNTYLYCVGEKLLHMCPHKARHCFVPQKCPYHTHFFPLSWKGFLFERLVPLGVFNQQYLDGDHSYCWLLLNSSNFALIIYLWI